MMDEVGTSKQVEAGKPLVLSKPLAVQWRPCQLVFRPYAPSSITNAKTQSLRVAVRRPLVVRLTKDIVETYHACNPQFQFPEELNPKRFLTSPSVGVLNDGYDNANSDLILSVNLSLVKMETQKRYIIKEMLGHGTFGQVAKCWVPETKSFVAVKIIKNQPAYYQQALVEVSILTTLNTKFDPEDKHHIVRIYDYFVYQRHLCIVFELLDTNLYELIKLNHFRGLSLSIVQLFSKQILHGLALMKDAGIIHCDLKPENILLCTSVKPAEIKIIDFGSACMEDRTVYSYIQSRYYRSPEVLLGYHYTTAIDMWSFGCIVAELYLGLPLFPGASEFDLLQRMIKIIGGQPPDYVLKEAKNTNKFFKCVATVNTEDIGQVPMSRHSAFQALTEEEYEARESKKPSIGKEYFNHMNLETIVRKYPYRKNLAEEDMIKEGQVRLSLIDFLRGLVEFDPTKRWSPMQASKHPFVTGEPFTCPYQPAPETPHLTVSQNMKVDHHPAGGHWFAAGLSPNIPGGNMPGFHNSPHYQAVPYAHAGSYGSLGSHGSYNDGVPLGSSYGSYGDNSNMLAFYSPVPPSGMNIYAQRGVPILGTSPDARRRIIQNPHANGLGVSPSGNFVPMSLGTSPSQFTPPSGYGQVSGGSPGQYGSSSTARGSSQGSPLGKLAGTSQFHRRNNWVQSGSLHPQESSSPHPKGQFIDGSISSQAEGNSPLHGSSPHMHTSTNAASWRQQQGGSIYSASHNILNLSMPGSSGQFPHLKGASQEKSEASNSLPDPGDWDPYYSEELLLHEENSKVGGLENEFSMGMHLGQALDPTETLTGGKRYSGTLNTSSNMMMQRPIAQALTYGEVPSSSSLDTHGGFMHHMTKPPHILPQFQQNSSSRFGQQPSRQFNYGNLTSFHGAEWNLLKVQAPSSSFSHGGPRSPGSNAVPWGRHGNHSGMPPTSRGRKDYGRIT